jgi:type IV pilus assembly protein PilA
MKKNNNGFSLVELIIVIAIMAVLVGVLAPQFIKYVEQSRRSRDIQTAQEIRESVLAAIADGKLTGATTGSVSIGTGVLTVGSGNSIDTIAAGDTLTASGSIAKDSTFCVSYDAVNGTCVVGVSTYVLTTESGATSYKNATS